MIACNSGNIVHLLTRFSRCTHTADHSCRFLMRHHVRHHTADSSGNKLNKMCRQGRTVASGTSGQRDLISRNDTRNQLRAQCKYLFSRDLIGSSRCIHLVVSSAHVNPPLDYSLCYLLLCVNLKKQKNLIAGASPSCPTHVSALQIFVLREKKSSVILKFVRIFFFF